MKAAFSLLEIIIGILIIGLVSSFAIPNLLDSKDYASATTLKRDILSIVSSAQTYKLQNSDFSNIGEAIEINKNIWDDSEENTLKDKSGCVELEFNSSDSEITLTLTDSVSDICTKLKESGIDIKTYEL